jgi:hypothetical protein
MSEEPMGSETTRLERKMADRQVGLFTTVLVSAATAVAGGGAGSLATGQSVASELKEFRAVVLGRFVQLDGRFAEIGRNNARIEALVADHEKRMHALEIDAARRGVTPPR